MAQLRQEVDPGEAGLDAKALDRLDQHIAHYVDEGRLPGFLVAVARGGRVAHLTTHGRRDVAAGLPVEADTLWRLYSMTKPVTSVAALILVEEGRLSLDDPVAATFRPSPNRRCTRAVRAPRSGPALPSNPC